MAETSIYAENLGKRFKINRSQSKTLRESLGQVFGGILGATPDDPDKGDFWALKDISFTIENGEAVGIMGRNGAGKSTLLKILSRITQPTTGRVVIDGRVSSLLEVGTGFHPELTGRENIFLNGTILGMTRKEIKLKMEEIVDFSGVEKFVDTPVKHYSSGMKVRLAFSVAAYLEPEILLIDEVLAVGDSVFQKKCVDKMLEVTRSGRTVLFVSHNMQAVKNLCQRGILLDESKLIMDGEVNEVIRTYVTQPSLTSQQQVDLSKVERGKWAHGITFQKIQFNTSLYHPGDSLAIDLTLQSDGKSYQDLLFGVNLNDQFSNNIYHLSNIFLDKINVSHRGGTKYRFVVDTLNLKPGNYSVGLFLRANEDIHDWITNAASITVQEGNVYGFNNSKMIHGLVQPEFTFEVLDE